MRIVIDTNLLVSGIIFGGLPYRLAENCLRGIITPLVSTPIVNEYRDTIARLMAKYPRKLPRFSLNGFLTVCENITPISRVEICRDPQDNKFLECAKDGVAAYLVSGDDDLLALKNYDDIPICTARQFLLAESLFIGVKE
ncbi:PIN domain-containing protein [Planctomycetales bacterium]|nr:PIN domain-containing protein [Planctomycetales bacterium]GHT00479.1 PIN domain-containing protein [Planctomycetales bacterium]GHT09442.1 PIN domain-containing protein [Planctomycetales bacterium]